MLIKPVVVGFVALFYGCRCQTPVNINRKVLKKEWNFRKLKDCTYIPEKANPMPGRESTLTGGWMRLVENGGYQHIMQLYTKIFFLISKNFHNVLTLPLYLSFFIAWVISATIVFIEALRLMRLVL